MHGERGEEGVEGEKERKKEKEEERRKGEKRRNKQILTFFQSNWKPRGNYCFFT